MKKRILLLIFALFFTEQINTKINTKSIGHVAKGLASAGAFGLTAYFTKNILTNDMPNLFDKLKVEGMTKENLLISTLAACLFYTCYRTAKISYKNFKNAYKNTQDKKQIQNSSPDLPGIIVHGPGISVLEDKNGIHVFETAEKKQSIKNKKVQQRK